MNRIPPQSWMTAAPTRAVLDALQADGRTVRFVGGCVRDAILGRPVNDIDIATPDPPETVMALLDRAGLKAVPTGLAHGTVTAVADGQPFEITTLRRDVETDGRRATVAFTADWVADAARRDFTINAMFCGPDGTLFDPFGGLADLDAGRVVFVGNPDRRIREDYLRLLRFFRFHARYGRGGPDALGLRAATAHAGMLATLSRERIGDELVKLLGTAAPEGTVAVMTGHRILAPVVPEATRAAALRSLLKRVKDASFMSGFTEAWHAFIAPDAVRRLAALLGFGGGAADGVAARLRLSKQTSKRLATLTAPELRVAADGPARELRAALYRLGAGKTRDLLLLDAADRDVRGEGPEDKVLLEALITALDWEPKKLPISGADVKAAGVPPGPAVGRVLRAVEDWWIDRNFAPDRVACLAHLTRLAGDATNPGRHRT